MEYRSSTADLEGYRPFPDDRARAYQEAGHWRNRPLHELLDRAGEAHPEKPYLVGSDGGRTYAEVIERSRRVGAFLAGELGLEPLDRIALQLTNRPEFVELLFGCSRAGVIPVMVLPRHREAEARHVVELTDARAYVTPGAEAWEGDGDGDDDGHDFTGTIDGIVDDLPTLDHRIAIGSDAPDGWIDYESIVGDAPPAEHASRLDSLDVNPCDPALFLLSGGTTGMPKAIPRTHNDYAFQWERMAEWADASADWTTLPAIPIGHNASLICVVGLSTVVGATVALEPRLKPDALLRTMADHGVNYFFAVPAQLVDFLERTEAEEYDLSSLESLISGGQKVRPWSVYEFEERWGTDFLNIFGMAEGPLICTRPDDPLSVQAETVGRPIAEADEFRIVDERRGAEVPPGHPGELAARGPGVFTGYFRNPEENAENFDEAGWFYTEDVLERGEDGLFRVHGRLKDTIIRGGENVFAPGVEDELIEHPKVENVAVIGMPDERLGERIVAYVELEDNVGTLDLDELVSFLDDRGIAVFKRPERLEVVEALPRTEVGKIDKADLRERITARLRAEGALPEEY